VLLRALNPLLRGFSGPHGNLWIRPVVAKQGPKGVVMRMRPRAAALAISLVVAASGTGTETASQAAATGADTQDVSLEDGTQKASAANSASALGASTETPGVPKAHGERS
jgi:hypothetical protein